MPTAVTRFGSCLLHALGTSTDFRRWQLPGFSKAASTFILDDNDNFHLDFRRQLRAFDNSYVMLRSFVAASRLNCKFQQRQFDTLAASTSIFNGSRQFSHSPISTLIFHLCSSLKRLTCTISAMFHEMHTKFVFRFTFERSTCAISAKGSPSAARAFQFTLRTRRRAQSL